VPHSYYFCIKNALKLTYEHLYFKKKKNFSSLSHALRGRERNTMEETQERGGEGRGGEGKGQGTTASKFGTLSTPLAGPLFTDNKKSVSDPTGMDHH
jgi:hypothetical protein